MKKKLKNENYKFQNNKYLKKIQPNQKKNSSLKKNIFIKLKNIFFKKIKSTNQIKILFLWVDSDGPP